MSGVGGLATSSYRTYQKWTRRILLPTLRVSEYIDIIHLLYGYKHEDQLLANLRFLFMNKIGPILR